MFRVVAWGLGLGLVLAGCVGDGERPNADDLAESPAAESTEEQGDLDRSREFEAVVRAEVTGAATFVWEGRQTVALTRVGAPDLEANMLAAGFLEPQVVDGEPEKRFRWGFELFDQYADEPGTFQITGAAAGEQKLRDAALLVYVVAKDPSKPQLQDWAEVESYQEFNQVRRACTLQIGPAEATGTLECPELASAEGDTVAIKITWTALNSG